MKVLCGVPIDYTGGFCRLYRDKTKTPLKTLQTNSYVCEFFVSSRELLAGRRAGTRTTVRCDYTLQKYVSVSSDNKAVVVWGMFSFPLWDTVSNTTCLCSCFSIKIWVVLFILPTDTPEKPVLKMSPQVVMLGGRVQVNCDSPLSYASECMVYRDTSYLGEIPCSHQMKAETLMLWRPISLFNEISIHCKYNRGDYVRSNPSNPKKILLVGR